MHVIQTKPLPELKFNGKILIPFDSRVNGDAVTLFYPADTAMPTNVHSDGGWSDQLAAQGYRLAGYSKAVAEVSGVKRGSVMVIAMKVKK